MAPRKDLVGIAWMLASGLCFVSVNGIVRALGDSLAAPQSAWLRFMFGVILLAPALRRLGPGVVPRDLWGRVALRGALHTGAVVLWFYAMARIPIAEVTAIGFLNPIIVTLGAALVLGEALSGRRVAAVAVALAGALVVLRPGLRELDPGHLAQTGAAVLFGSSYIAAKSLSERIPAATVVALMSLAVTIFLAPLAIAVWRTPTIAELASLALVAVFASLGHYSMTRSFAAAPLTVTQPVTFLQLIWASLLGVAVFSEPLDPMVLLGGGMMIGAISYITWRESRGRGRVTPPVPATRA